MATEPLLVRDEDLARSTQAGSLDAFEELVRRYQVRVAAFLVSFRFPKIDEELIVQDTFVRAFQAIHRYDARRPFAPWLLTIARHQAIDHLRSRPPAPDELPAPEPQDLNDPSVQLSQAEERQALWQMARQALPQLQFQALWLHYVVDLDVAGVAQVLGKTQTHVKVLLFRARHTLGNALREQEGSSPAGDGARAIGKTALRKNPQPQPFLTA